MMSMPGRDPEALAALSIALAALQRSALGNQEFLDTTLMGVLRNHGDVSIQARDIIEAKLSHEARVEVGRKGL